MFSRIETLSEKKLLGKSKRMSFLNNTTRELWQWFQPRRPEIKNVVGTDLYSLEVYDDASFFKTFNPANEFNKWAAVEVSDFDHIPAELDKLIIPTGLYAVFIHKGPASEGKKTYEYIFYNWFTSSKYELDHRPHFAIMGPKYKAESPDSEEEIWIPVKKKA
ncbi:MAG: AraC family transcriptional regulator [Sphingobacteriaceae bacterium]|nr:AraC family transcriptional regulator [Sphingobacteriaceae bacterium]